MLITARQAIAGPAGASAFVASTFAALRALSPAVTGDSCVVAGRSSAGDPGAGTFLFFAGDGTADDNANTIRPAANSGAWKRVNGGELEVTAFGARTDGSDAAPALTAAIASAAALARPMVLTIRPGTYALYPGPVSPYGIPVVGKGLTLRGAGREATILKLDPAHGFTIGMFLADGATCVDLTIEDMTIDFSSCAFRGFWVQNAHHFRFRNTRFRNGGGQGSIYVNAAHAIEIDDRCVFENDVPNSAPGVWLNDSPVASDMPANGGHSIRIEDCEFWNMASAISGPGYQGGGVGELPGVNLLKGVAIRRCLFEGSWWGYPVRNDANGVTMRGTTGVNATVADTSITLDASFAMPSIALYSQVRLLRTIATGTITDARQATPMTLGGAGKFGAILFRHFYFVRASTGGVVTHFAFVGEAGSADALRLEGWVDPATLLPKAPPGVGATWTVYEVIQSSIGAIAGRTLTMHDPWYDGAGGTYTAAQLTAIGATAWELAIDHGGYAGPHFGYGTRGIEAEGNTVRRSWADSISLYGDESVIRGNTVYECQDQGLTTNMGINPSPTGRDVGLSIVEGNNVFHCGSNGVSAWSNARIRGNSFHGNGFANHVNWWWLADIVVSGSNVVVSDNVCDGEGLAHSRCGLVTWGASNVQVYGNVFRGHTTSEASPYPALVPCAIRRYEDPTIPLRTANEYIGPNIYDGETTAISQITGSTAGVLSVIGPTTDINWNATTKVVITGAIAAGAFVDVKIVMLTPTTFAWYLGGVLQATGVGTGPAVALGTTGLSANFVGPFIGGEVYIHQSASGAGTYDTGGSGAPTHYAAPGSTYRRRDGAGGTALYVKESNALSNSWTRVALTFEEGAASPTIQQSARTTDTAPNDLTITPQQAWASATGTNRNPGSLVVSLQAPASGATAPGLVVKQANTPSIRLVGGAVPLVYLTPTYAAAPGAGATYSLAGDNSSNTYVNAPTSGGAVWITIAGGQNVQFTTTRSKFYKQLSGYGAPFALANASINMGDADVTPTSAQYESPILYLYGALTATRKVTLPIWTNAIFFVVNATSGGQSITVGGASGGTVTIAAGKTAILWCDGVNYVRITADA